MFHLSESQLDLGFQAIQTHGYGSFFPPPPEVDVIYSAWPEFRAHLAAQDLDTYKCYESLSAFVPKSRLNIRWVSLLHPFDLIMYTSIVLALRDDISSARIPIKDGRVFSYRAEGVPNMMLYGRRPGWKEFRLRQAKKVEGKTVKFVGVADVADFYPRIYQHRLVNAIDSL